MGLVGPVDVTHILYVCLSVCFTSVDGQVQPLDAGNEPGPVLFCSVYFTSVERPSQGIR
jgi:hypothetical protein